MYVYRECCVYCQVEVSETS